MCSIILMFLVLTMSTVRAEFYGEYIFRLEKWNSGKLYVSENNGFYLSKFGTVCREVNNAILKILCLNIFYIDNLDMINHQDLKNEEI